MAVLYCWSRVTKRADRRENVSNTKTSFPEEWGRYQSGRHMAARTSSWTDLLRKPFSASGAKVICRLQDLRTESKKRKTAHKEIHHEKSSDISCITYVFIIICSSIMFSDFSRRTRTRATTGTETRTRTRTRTRTKRFLRT